ncbi:hypothetical protein myaer87_43130 [Microcystis aeruginosa NIES-87]|nr:hypothetical protein myaer87_43130 [Microcystis aeruginosa NIES-87]
MDWLELLHKLMNFAIVHEALPLANRILIQHHGFTEEELDFINYDIKYRMGRDSES